MYFLGSAGHYRVQAPPAIKYLAISSIEKKYIYSNWCTRGRWHSSIAEPPRNQVGKTRLQYKELQSRVKHCTQQDKIKINQLRGTFFWLYGSFLLVVGGPPIYYCSNHIHAILIFVLLPTEILRQNHYRCSLSTKLSSLCLCGNIYTCMHVRFDFRFKIVIDWGEKTMVQRWYRVIVTPSCWILINSFI